MRAGVLLLAVLVSSPGVAGAFDPDTPLSNASASFLGEDSYDYAGWSVASGGDVNGDGFDDLLIGADNDEEGGSSAGQTYLVLAPAAPPVPALPSWGLAVTALVFLAAGAVLARRSRRR